MRSRDAAHLQLVLLAEFQQLRQPRHRAIGIQDFAKHAGRRKPASRARSTLASVWPARRKHAAGLRAQRKDVAGLHEIVRRGFGIDEHLDRARPIVRADAGGHAFRGIDRDREIRAIALAILQHHPLQTRAAPRARR